MTSFNYTDKILELENQIGTPDYISIMARTLKTQVVNFSLNQVVRGKEFLLDKSYNLTPAVETYDNNTIKQYHLIEEFNEYYGLTRMGLFKAKSLQGVDTNYWVKASRLAIVEQNKLLDKEIYLGDDSGNKGLITGVATSSVTITTGKALVDTMVSEAGLLNSNYGLDAVAPVTVYLSGELKNIYLTNIYNDYKTINEMIPSWINVIPLGNFINTTNRMDIVSSDNVLLYRGILPSVISNGVEEIKDHNFVSWQGIQVGYQSASVFAKSGLVKSILKA
jgi:hypothetical protein